MKYKGQLKGFPQEVVEKMLEKQVEQGNKRDITVFEKYIPDYQDGFYWAITKEGHAFWNHVISNKDFNLFFKKYPKQEYPKVMLVWENYEELAKPRVVFMEKNGRYLAWSCAKTLEEAESTTSVAVWRNAKPLPKHTEMTVAEIEEALKKFLNITNLKIIP